MKLTSNGRRGGTPHQWWLIDGDFSWLIVCGFWLCLNNVVHFFIYLLGCDFLQIVIWMLVLSYSLRQWWFR
jgi:hypothetical protein